MEIDIKQIIKIIKSRIIRLQRNFAFSKKLSYEKKYFYFIFIVSIFVEKKLKYIFNIKPYFQKLNIKEKFILQEFILTGINAISYRVLNFFGEALCFYSITIPKAIYLPNNLDEAFNNNTVQTNLKKAKAIRKFEYNNQILNFSKKIFNVFNEKPIQGTDIIIDKKTNKLLVLEANQIGRAHV